MLGLALPVLALPVPELLEAAVAADKDAARQTVCRWVERRYGSGGSIYGSDLWRIGTQASTVYREILLDSGTWL